MKTACWGFPYCKKANTEGVCNRFCGGYVLLDLLYKRSNLPKKYQQTVQLFVPEKDTEAYTEILKIKESIVSWVQQGKNLVLWGENKGNGKTTLACSLANAYIREMAKQCCFDSAVYFIKTAKFLEELRSQFNNPEEGFSGKLRLIETVPLLIIDDIGAEKASEWVRERLLTIIDERYSNNLSTIYTSNCTQYELLENLHGRIVDRLKEAKTIQLVGQSMRGVNYE